MQGPVSERIASSRAAGAFKDLSVRETFAITPLILLIVGLGVYPKPIIDIINPAVKYTMQDIGKTDPQPQNAAQLGGHK
jgi:NADH-quinone oxidoreductase subunit M